MFEARLEVDNCGDDHDPVSVLHREGETSREDLLFDNYKKCELPHGVIPTMWREYQDGGTDEVCMPGNTGGTGAYIQDGYFRYTFWPCPRRDEESDKPIDP